MDFLLSSAPIWLSALFLLSIPVPVFMLAQIVGLRTHPQRLVMSKYSRPVLLFFGAFFLCVLLTSLTGFFSVNTLPPRLLVTTVLPLFLFYTIVVARSNWYTKLVRETPLSSLVFVHVFRFIGVFFLLLYGYELLPADFALVAGIGDILTAITSIFVVKALRSGKAYARRLTYVWNAFGLLDILLVLVTAVMATRESIAAGTTGITEMGTFPFCLIPAFAPATIIFLHITVLRKLSQQQS